MKNEVRQFNGILRIDGESCYLVRLNCPSSTRPVLLFLNSPTGAAFFEGFAAATYYVQDRMKKTDGDPIWVRGIESEIGDNRIIQFLPDELELKSSAILESNAA